MNQTQLTEHHSVWPWVLLWTGRYSQLRILDPCMDHSLKSRTQWSFLVPSNSDYSVIPWFWLLGSARAGSGPKKAKTIGLPCQWIVCLRLLTRLDLPPVFTPNSQAASAWARHPCHGDTVTPGFSTHSAWAGRGWPLKLYTDLPSLESWFGVKGGQHIYFRQIRIMRIFHVVLYFGLVTTTVWFNLRSERNFLLCCGVVMHTHMPY